MFDGLGGELPLPTKFLVFLSSTMRFLLPILIVTTACLSGCGGSSARLPRVRNIVDPLKLRLPVFGDLSAKLALARFARNLSTLLSSGVPIFSRWTSWRRRPVRS
jgi:type IV pilus assembly protein PilC